MLPAIFTLSASASSFLAVMAIGSIMYPDNSVVGYALFGCLLVGISQGAAFAGMVIVVHRALNGCWNARRIWWFASVGILCGLMPIVVAKILSVIDADFPLAIAWFLMIAGVLVWPIVASVFLFRDAS